MKVLNLYCGIGGNRKLWTDCEITAVEFNPDIILSDYMLPQFTGMEALKIAREFSPLIPFIIMNHRRHILCP